ncbi:TPA: hypothetical protein I8032_000298 [Legionella pneumophila]|nr:hypothetical protein [Legionella pneumophila]
MNRIIPKISTGNLELLISETVCFNPLDGLQINLATINSQTGQLGADVIFNFIFLYDGTGNNQIRTTIDKDKINIHIPNFGNALISGLTKPLTFQFGNIPITLFFTGMLLTNEMDANAKLMQFTVSIYQGNVK